MALAQDHTASLQFLPYLTHRGGQQDMRYKQGPTSPEHTLFKNEAKKLKR